jgi:hypothetical protein
VPFQLENSSGGKMAISMWQVAYFWSYQYTPYAIGQGIILKEQGILACEIRNRRRMRFSGRTTAVNNKVSSIGVRIDCGGADAGRNDHFTNPIEIHGTAATTRSPISNANR